MESLKTVICKFLNEKDMLISFFPKNNSYIVDASGFHYEITENMFTFITPKEFSCIFNKLSSDLVELPKFVIDFINKELS